MNLRISKRRRLPAGVLALLTLVSSSGALAHWVVYTLSGELQTQQWVPEDPAPDWEPFTATFAFDGHSEPIPHEDAGWFWHRPASWMRFEFRERIWRNANPRTCGELDMKEGYAGISWGCTLISDAGGEGRIYLDIRDASGLTGPYSDPYPMGPFTPENFREFELWTTVGFSTETDALRGSVRLDDVRFVGEPGMISLLCATFGVLLVHRRGRLQ